MQPPVQLGAWGGRCAGAGWGPAAAGGQQGDLLHLLLEPCLGLQGRGEDRSLGCVGCELRGRTPGQPLLLVGWARWMHVLSWHLPSLLPWQLVAA